MCGMCGYNPHTRTCSQINELGKKRPLHCAAPYFDVRITRTSLKNSRTPAHVTESTVYGENQLFVKVMQFGVFQGKEQRRKWKHS
jgi:hypothetical protein